jgi:DNA-binding winged helix-turn-helix (wHTH) protein
MGDPVTEPMQADQITISEEKARILLIGNRKVYLTPQQFEVFRYLYLHMNEVCSKEELLSTALKGEYDERNLHTLVSRIRRVIEYDPEHPRYLLTEPNSGYRLIPKPKS